MTPRKLFPAVALPLLLALGLLAACGGDGQQELARPGQLTDPRTVPTATPWTEPPEAIILEPGAITPLSGGGEGPEEDGQNGAGNDGTVTPGTCGETYTVQSGDNPSIIAEKCGVTLEALLEANPDIEPTNLHIGDVLKIPR